MRFYHIRHLGFTVALALAGLASGACAHDAVPVPSPAAAPVAPLEARADLAAWTMSADVIPRTSGTSSPWTADGLARSLLPRSATEIRTTRTLDVTTICATLQAPASAVRAFYESILADAGVTATRTCTPDGATRYVVTDPLGSIDVRDDPSHPDRTLVTISLATVSAGLEE